MNCKGTDQSRKTSLESIVLILVLDDWDLVQDSAAEEERTHVFSLEDCLGVDGVNVKCPNLEGT